MEFSLLLPVFLLVLFGMIEFGFVFTHNLTLEYATREGARAGAALGNGNGSGLTCAAGTNSTCVDPLIIAAVERVLQSPGSQIVVANISQIVIYKANPTTGADDQGYHDVWTYSYGAGPVVDGVPLNFVDGSYPGSDAWKASARSNTAPSVDSIGVRLTYTYSFKTPLASILRFFGGGLASLTMNDRTVMDLNPTAS